ncbi:hypothetical protein J6590_071127 [Homalodisca vitripennis]|nr:hypothetical protein J6590_071127 [Homalodisca vitripennis]
MLRCAKFSQWVKSRKGFQRFKVIAVKYDLLCGQGLQGFESSQVRSFVWTRTSRPRLTVTPVSKKPSVSEVVLQPKYLNFTWKG